MHMTSPTHLCRADDKPIAPLQSSPLVRFVVVAMLCLACTTATTTAAMASDQQQTVLDKAHSEFRTGNELADQNPAEAHKHFTAAALRFQQLIEEDGIKNGALFYNIGNCYFRMQDIGNAILYYRKAQRYTPNDANLMQNLEFARAHRKDRVDIAAQARVLQTLFFWHYDINTRTRSAIFISCFILSWLGATLLVFGVRPPWLRWTTAATATLTCVLLGSLLLEHTQQKAVTHGVILNSETVGRKGDSTAYEPSFKEPLHAGTEFVVLEQRPDWNHVALQDGRTTWLPARSVGFVEEH